MKQCPFCHKSIEDDDIQCRYCDEWLDIIPKSRKMKTCPFCQKQIDSDEIQCTYCGEWLDIIESPRKKTKIASASVTQQTKFKKMWDTYGYIMIVIMVIMITFVLYEFNQKVPLEKNEGQVKEITSPDTDTASAPTRTSVPVRESLTLEKPVSPRTRAEDLFKKALALCPGGKCTDSQKAIEYLDEAIKLEPNMVTAYANRGLIYGELGQQQKAIEDFSKSIRLKPNLTSVYYNRGCSYGKLGQYKQAIEDFSESIRLKPDDANAYSGRATAYLAQKNKELGCADAQKACEMGNCKSLEGAKAKGICR